MTSSALVSIALAVACGGKSADTTPGTRAGVGGTLGVSGAGNGGRGGNSGGSAGGGAVSGASPGGQGAGLVGTGASGGNQSGGSSGAAGNLGVAGLSGTAGVTGEAGSGGALNLPELPITLESEITLAALPEPAEDIYVGVEGLLIVTQQQQHRYDFEGAPLSDPAPGGSRTGATGVDAFETRWVATVNQSAFAWYEFEVQVQLLSGAQAATGLAMDTQESGGFERFFVSDSAVGAVLEYTSSGAPLRDLPIPDTDLQGMARAPDGKFFALDAKRSELLRLSSDFSEVDAFAKLPTVANEPTGIHWFEETLYVCFRDSDRVALVRLSPESNGQ